MKQGGVINPLFYSLQKGGSYGENPVYTAL